MGSWRGIELDDVELSGPGLRLRRWRADDAEAVVDVMQDRSMYEFLNLPDPYTRATADEFVTSIGHEGRGDGTGLGCAVVERTSGLVVGSAALRLAGGGEVGYWIRRSARGQGYATEATRILTDWGFAAGLARALLLCDVRNLASVRVALAAGFRFEGVERAALPADPPDPAVHGDLARFGLLAHDDAAPIAAAFAALPADGLRDGVVILREMREHDATGFTETDDAVAASWNFTGQRRSADEARRAAMSAGLQRLVGRQAQLSIIDAASGDFAGDIVLRHAGPPGVGGVGYAIHPAFRGRGYTTRALRLLAAWAFDVAGFARLELGAKTGNVASQRAAASADFHPDGVRRARLRNADGTYSDEVRYALINPRYR